MNVSLGRRIARQTGENPTTTLSRPSESRQEDVSDIEWLSSVSGWRERRFKPSHPAQGKETA
jgi:hypothetical protein